MQALRLYTDYTLESEECLSKNGLWKAETGILKQLKDDMQTGKHLRTTTRFYFRLPLSTAHKVHPVGEAATVAHSIHLKITSKICERGMEMLRAVRRQRNVWKSWRSSEIPKVEWKILPQSPGLAKSYCTSNQHQQTLWWWPRVTKAQNWGIEAWLPIIQVLFQGKGWGQGWWWDKVFVHTPRGMAVEIWQWPFTNGCHLQNE